MRERVNIYPRIVLIIMGSSLVLCCTSKCKMCILIELAFFIAAISGVNEIRYVLILAEADNNKDCV